MSSPSIDAFVQQPALAVVGVSRTGKKFGNIACRELRAQGYRVYPIHPTASAIDGLTCHTSFAALPEHVDAVLIVVPPPSAIQVIHDAAAAGIRHVWLQQGAESLEALRLCTELGLDVVSGQCILMFAGKPHGIHRMHGWIWRVLGKTPSAA